MSVHRHRAVRLLIGAVAIAALATACKSTPTPVASAPPSPTPSPTPALAAAPTCAEIKNSSVRGLIDPYYAFGPEGAPLVAGMYSGKDGLVLAVQAPCATGNLGGEIGNVTVGAIMSSIVDTTGRIWSVMLCSSGKAKPDCVVHFALDDRDPIESVSVADQKLTLVYLTRGEGDGSAVVNVRRTAIFANTGSILKEQSHVDAPYTP